MKLQLHFRLEELFQKYHLQILTHIARLRLLVKRKYWKDIGINCITGIYEPFGYTICECLDRRVPVIVSNIDGPKEIVEEVINHVYPYEVDIDNYENDIHNFTGALNIVLNTSAEEREKNAEQARKALDKLRPENIKGKWIQLFNSII